MTDNMSISTETREEKFRTFVLSADAEASPNIRTTSSLWVENILGMSTVCEIHVKWRNNEQSEILHTGWTRCSRYRCSDYGGRELPNLFQRGWCWIERAEVCKTQACNAMMWPANACVHIWRGNCVSKTAIPCIDLNRCLHVAGTSDRRIRSARILPWRRLNLRRDDNRITTYNFGEEQCAIATATRRDDEIQQPSGSISSGSHFSPVPLLVAK